MGYHPNYQGLGGVNIWGPNCWCLVFILPGQILLKTGGKNWSLNWGRKKGVTKLGVLRARKPGVWGNHFVLQWGVPLGVFLGNIKTLVLVGFGRILLWQDPKFWAAGFHTTVFFFGGDIVENFY